MHTEKTFRENEPNKAEKEGAPCCDSVLKQDFKAGRFLPQAGKKAALAAAFFTFSSALCLAVTFETKSNVTFGITPAEKVSDESSYEQSKQFGGAYFLGDFALSNEKITAAGKIYCRLKPAESQDEASQQLDIKRAFIRYRPFSSNLLEFSLGKLYSYYLPGNYFQLSEIYTGATRWGKTGAGVKIEHDGFSFGLGLPLKESKVAFKDSFSLNAAACYDFSFLSASFSLKAGADVLYTRTGAVYSSKTGKKTSDTDYDFSKSVSLYFTPKISGFFKSPALTLTYSHNAEPYVSSSVFKNVSNYKNSDMAKSHFASLNFRGNFGSVQLIAEGEAGHSVSGSMIPLYAGTQLLVPVYEKTVWFKPRFYYYAALDSSDSGNSRTTFEFYPRAWITAGKVTVSAGADVLHKEYEKDFWKWEWSLPLYVQYKI